MKTVFCQKWKFIISTSPLQLTHSAMFRSVILLASKKWSFSNLPRFLLPSSRLCNVDHPKQIANIMTSTMNVIFMKVTFCWFESLYSCVEISIFGNQLLFRFNRLLLVKFSKLRSVQINAPTYHWSAYIANCPKWLFWNVAKSWIQSPDESEEVWSNSKFSAKIAKLKECKSIVRIILSCFSWKIGVSWKCLKMCCCPLFRKASLELLWCLCLQQV